MNLAGSIRRALCLIASCGLILILTIGAANVPPPVFDVHEAKGIDFTLQNSPTARKYLIETMPGGVALLDYNNDGLLDIFLVNGGKIADPESSRKISIADPRYWNRLYRQNRDGSFTDVTAGRPGVLRAMATTEWG